MPKNVEVSQELEAQIRSGHWESGKMPSLRAIAEQHGISVVTASRALQVLRDKGLVETRERSGCYLTEGGASSECWALHLRITPGGPLAQASAAPLSAGFETIARQERFALLADTFDFAAGASRREFQRQIEQTIAAGVQGVFFLPTRLSEEALRQDEVFLEACRAAALPVVLLERNLRGSLRPLEWDLVCFDDMDGGSRCTQHLLDQDRRKIAFVTSSPTSSHDGRLAGYLLALHRAGRTNPLVLTQDAARPSKEAYRRLADRLVALKADGAVCYGDYAAVGLIMELMARRIRVPHDVAITGFDNLPIGSLFAVGVTTYAYSPEEAARQALRLMRRRIAVPDAAPIKVVVPGELIARESSVAATWLLRSRRQQPGQAHFEFGPRQSADEEALVATGRPARQLHLRTLQAQRSPQHFKQRLVRPSVLRRSGHGRLQRSPLLADHAFPSCSRLRTHGQQPTI